MRLEDDQVREKFETFRFKLGDSSPGSKALLPRYAVSTLGWKMRNSVKDSLNLRGKHPGGSEGVLGLHFKYSSGVTIACTAFRKTYSEYIASEWELPSNLQVPSVDFAASSLTAAKMGRSCRGSSVAHLKLLMPLMLFVGISEGSPLDYGRWKVLAVNLEQVSGDAYPPTLSKLEDMEAEGYLVVLSASKIKGIAEVAVSSEALEDLIKMQDDGLITFDLICNNLRRALDLEKRGAGKNLPRASVTFTSYMSFSQISSYLDGLPAQYPNKIRVDKPGRTIENRAVYRVRLTNNITDNVQKKVVLIDGGIHAREWVSPAAALYIIETLIANTGLTESIEWQIMPVLNPDGYVYSWSSNRLWRKNRSRSSTSTCVGVDLNRNFGYQWGGLGTSGNPCSEVYKGTSAFTERESKTLRDVMLPLNGKLKAYLSLHSYGQYILYPWGYSTQATPHPLSASMDTAAQAMAGQIKNTTQAVYRAGNSAITLYSAAGISVDWASYAMNITYAYTLELRDTGSYGFTLPAAQILPTVRDAWEVVKILASLV
ncbi:carboxypeptidase B-like [Macrobrachium nipponense]|uniref:carboxypeptidase B-like n=1 Tax=Macrobrachium nipponense TaxID=159736 RepID=UPI0030C81085